MHRGKSLSDLPTFHFPTVSIRLLSDGNSHPLGLRENEFSNRDFDPLKTEFLQELGCNLISQGLDQTARPLSRNGGHPEGHCMIINSK